MKIIAVGMNYAAHCHELHADEKLPEEPVIFMKPDSALLKDSKPFFIPDFSAQSVIDSTPGIGFRVPSRESSPINA